MSDDRKSADMPACEAEEIDVTPEMIEAGVDAVFSVIGDLVSSVGGEARDLVLAVYSAMENVRVKETDISLRRTL